MMVVGYPSRWSLLFIFGFLWWSSIYILYFTLQVKEKYSNSNVLWWWWPDSVRQSKQQAQTLKPRKLQSSATLMLLVQEYSPQHHQHFHFYSFSLTSPLSFEWNWGNGSFDHRRPRALVQWLLKHRTLKCWMWLVAHSPPGEDLKENWRMPTFVFQKVENSNCNDESHGHLKMLSRLPDLGSRNFRAL